MSNSRPEDEVYSLSIGSKPDNDLVFDRPTISGRHAHIYWDAEARHWMLEDLGSTNGTFFKGTRLRPGDPVSVREGDTIYLGKSFHFELEAAHLELIQVRADEQLTPAPLEASDPLLATLAFTPIGAGELESESETTDVSGPPSKAGDESVDTHDGRAHSGETEEILPSLKTTEMDRVLDPIVQDQVKAALRRTSPSMKTEVLDKALLDRAAARVGSPSQTSLLPQAEPPPPDAPSISIGYADDNTVQLKNPVVSGHHARLYRLDGAFVLEDQGSTNGTWVRGKRIQRIELTERDAFNLGNHELAVADLVQYFDAPLQLGPRTTDRQMPLPGKPITIGRSPDCDVRLEAPMISAVHARLIALGGGFYRLEDLGSTNGTFVNSRDNQIETATVGPRDVIFLGSYRLPLRRLSSLVSGLDGEQELLIPPDKDVLVVGRDDQVCDIVLRAPQVSRRHAEIRRLEGGAFDIRDLGSINGTWVNGERIKSKRITVRDLVSFASVRVRLDAAAGVVRRDYHGDMMLQAERITVHVRDKKHPGGYRTILNDASFTVYPTEFVGLMGASGAGKTTLMLALNGYTLPTAGRSLINGYDLYSNYNSFRGNIGYVPQDDIIYSELTVFESLYYTAKLRLPPDTTDEEIRLKLDDVMEKLEIQQTRDVIVGDALKKGISGGQRKRVNLAQELITEPSLLFLDEPTSGLASEDAINVMNLLRKLADEGRTILLTIHQPSLEAYRKLDNVIYLFQGRLVYYGPAYPDGIAFFYPGVEMGTPEGNLILADPGNALKALADDQRAALDSQEPWEALDDAVEQRSRMFQGSHHYKDYVYDRAVAPRDQVRLAEGSKQKTERRGWLRQWWILAQRYFTIKRKDVANTAILLLQAPIIGVVLWLVFAAQVSSYYDMLSRGPSALFLLVASAVWFGCSNSAREIVREQAIYKRERMVNLMIPSYVLAKFVVLGAVCAIQCAILLGIVYPTLGYRGSPLLLYMVLLLSSLAGVGMGLTLSALVRSSEAAMALVPLLLIPQIVLGGVIMPIHELNPTMRLLSAAMVSRWGYEGVLNVEYGDDDLDQIRQQCGIDLCPDPQTVAARMASDSDTEVDRIFGAFGIIEDLSYSPTGEGVGQDVCTILCANARQGTEVSPLERVFGLDLEHDPMRRHYFEEYGVGREGSRTDLPTSTAVLIFFNLLLFGLVCALLRYKDVEVG